MRDMSQDWRFLTSPLRMLPDFIIAGEAKCGTSSLYHYLTQHPCVLPADRKEPGNFWRYGRSSMLCRAHYPFAFRRLAGRFAGRALVTGEGSAEYFSKREVPAVIRDVVPEARIIVILREPVARAYSDHQMFFKDGRVKEPFETIARRSVAWIRDESLKPLVDAVSQLEWNPVRYIHRGLYVVSARRWLESFSRDRMLFLRSEDLFADPQGVTNRVFAFLGLKEYPLVDMAPRKVGRYSGNIAPELRRFLSDFYRPYNEELALLLGEGFRWEDVNAA